MKAGIAVTDLMTAQYAHGAILAALYQRTKTALGQKIDCSLLSTQVRSTALCQLDKSTHRSSDQNFARSKIP